MAAAVLSNHRHRDKTNGVGAADIHFQHTVEELTNLPRSQICHVWPKQLWWPAKADLSVESGSSQTAAWHHSKAPLLLGNVSVIVQECASHKLSGRGVVWRVLQVCPYKPQRFAGRHSTSQAFPLPLWHRLISRVLNRGRGKVFACVRRTCRPCFCPDRSGPINRQNALPEKNRVF